LINARGSTITFLVGITVVVLIGMFPDMRPAYKVIGDGAVDTDQVGMGMAIMIVMLTIAGLTTLLFKASPNVMLKGSIMSSGISAIISIIGVSWLGSSFWAFGAGLFILSSMLFSAAATVAILVPVGIAVGLPPYLLVAFYPAANSVFFFPTYGTLLAAVSFDQTGTTKIGKLLLNHSFMRPGLVTMVASVVIAFCLGRLLLQ
jgi:anaerobic C4-dicarboxylate transporter